MRTVHEPGRALARATRGRKWAGDARPAAAPRGCALLLSSALVLLAGCEGWPRFDYAPLDDVYLDENEVQGNVAQNLGTLLTRTIISGSVDATGISDSGSGDQLSYEGVWYTGDVDYYAFSVREELDVDIALSWPADNTGLDLFLYRYDPETHGLSDLLDAAVADPGNGEVIYGDGLVPDELYIVVVAGRSGPSTSYDLTLLPSILS